MPDVMTRTERGRLAELEGVISRGARAFVEVGEALIAIRDERLYRERYDTFEAYCRAKWGISSRYGNILIGSSKVAKAVVNQGMPAPASADSVAPLIGLRPADQAEAYRMAVEASGGQAPPRAATMTTAELVRAARDGLTAGGLARLGELDQEQLRREHEAALRQAASDKRARDRQAAVDRLRHAAKAMRRLGWEDLAARADELMADAGKRAVDNLS